MCDEIDCDGCCDGDCCDNECCCTPSAPQTTPEHDHECLLYLCCAGCLLCPLFYVGTMKRAEEPITTPVESAAATRNDDVTVAATAMTSETTDIPETKKLMNNDIPFTVMMDQDKLNIIKRNDPIASAPPMDRM